MATLICSRAVCGGFHADAAELHRFSRDLMACKAPNICQKSLPPPAQSSPVTEVQRQARAMLHFLAATLPKTKRDEMHADGIFYFTQPKIFSWQPFIVIELLDILFSTLNL